MPHPEFDGILLGQVREKHTAFGLRYVPDSPGRPNHRPRALSGRNVVARQVIPPLAVLSCVLGRVIDGAPYDLDADPMWASPLTENFNLMQG